MATDDMVRGDGAAGAAPRHAQRAGGREERFERCQIEVWRGRGPRQGDAPLASRRAHDRVAGAGTNAEHMPITCAGHGGDLGGRRRVRA